MVSVLLLSLLLQQYQYISLYLCSPIGTIALYFEIKYNILNALKITTVVTYVVLYCSSTTKLPELEICCVRLYSNL